ncbi:MAG: hypothetical protein RIC95_01025 [Vicingaceae bacterium]
MKTFDQIKLFQILPHRMLLKCLGILCFLFLVEEAAAQKILALDKNGIEKRIRYYKGNFISLQTQEGIVVAGEITRILDSSFVVGNQIVKLTDVKKVKKTHKHFGWRFLSGLTFTVGGAYLGIDSFNRLINSDDPVVSEQSVFVSTVFIGLGTVSAILGNRNYLLGKKRRLKIIDISI